jgi:hypothetical protein
MRWTRVFLALIVLGAAAGGYSYYKSRPKIDPVKGQAEVEAQKPEIAECKGRLKLFHQAVEGYKADHGGAEPPTADALVPKYVKDANLFLCPTVKRWQGKGRTLNVGYVMVGKKEYKSSYGFVWLTGNSAFFRRRMGNKAPLIQCESHEEGMYLAYFGMGAKTGAFTGDARKGLPDEVAAARRLLVQVDGQVVEADPESE